MKNFDMEKIEKLAEKIHADKFERYSAEFTYDFSEDIKVHVKPGRKYVKIDIGSSGAYMIDQEGGIFGIKAYGVIHRGHRYGTLDTIDEWFWGTYSAMRRASK